MEDFDAQIAAQRQSNLKAIIGLILIVPLGIVVCVANSVPKQPVPKPSWEQQLDPACRTVTAPVASTCAEGGAPICPEEDGRLDGYECWWRDPVGGAVWYIEGKHR